MRLYFGPNIRLSHMKPPNNYFIYDYYRSGIGVGIIVGSNIHIMKRISLNLEIGGRANLYASSVSTHFTNEEVTEIGSQDGIYWMKHIELLFNFGIIFQLNND